MSQPTAIAARPPTWAVALALTLVYLTWGTTYLAIREGVKEFPPALFGGTRICLAGLLLLGFLRWRGQSLRITRRELGWLGLGGLFMFVGGNWLIALAEKDLPSGEASVLVATTPLWMVLLELAWPWGDRLRWQGWLGLGLGLLGVMLLMEPPRDLGAMIVSPSRLQVIGSAFCWAVGSFIMRHRPRGQAPRLVGAGYQLVLGGAAMSLFGLALGEAHQLTPEKFTGPAVLSYFHLLIFGSLVGYLAFVWLLDHVSAALAGSYAYVNPLVALLVGWTLGHEEIGGGVLLGLGVILGSVFLVRGGVVRPAPVLPAEGPLLPPLEKPTELTPIAPPR